LNKKNEQGYTLVEMLVAISLLAIVSVALASVFKQAYLAHSYGRSLLRFSEEGVIALNRIERDLLNVLPCQLHGMSGKEKELTFTAFLPTSVDDVTVERMPAWVTYQLDEANSSIFYRVVAVPGKSKPDSTVLCHPVDSLSFWYAIADDEGRLDWQSTLSASDASLFPKAIQVEIFLSDKTARSRENREFVRTVYLPLTRFASNEDE